MLVFGWRTAVLSLVTAQVLLLATGLALRPRNRTANRVLAALLLVVVGLLTPFTIGFAGFYDRWPWLSFAPFAVPLWLGPLFFAYAHALATGRLPSRLALHLAPGALEFGYEAVCFCLPLRTKAWWDRVGHEPFVDPLVSAGVVAGLMAYSLLALRLIRRYRAALPQVVADEHRFALGWLTRLLAAVLLVLAAEVGYQVWEWVFGRLDYFGVFGLYLALAAAALFLAVEGWRGADLAYPRPDALAAAVQPPVIQDAPARPAKDWRALGEAYAQRIEAEAWWREPELSLPVVAARLGANTHYLSRALNEGLGLSFSALVNRLRARAVAAALERGGGDDLLQLAFDCGFSSKASFNRAFRAEWGVTPSDYRRRGSDSKTSSPTPIVRRAAS